jgi:16S rRNA G966 N2-methylase RsmD
VTLVERDRHAVAALRANIEVLGVADRARALAGDVARHLAGLARAGERFGLIFLDPPYEPDQVTPTLARLGEGNVLAPGALVIAQHFTKRVPPETTGALDAFRTRRFGETTLTFFRARA